MAESPLSDQEKRFVHSDFTTRIFALVPIEENEQRPCADLANCIQLHSWPHSRGIHCGGSGASSVARNRRCLYDARKMLRSSKFQNDIALEVSSTLLCSRTSTVHRSSVRITSYPHSKPAVQPAVQSVSIFSRSSSCLSVLTRCSNLVIVRFVTYRLKHVDLREGFLLDQLTRLPTKFVARLAHAVDSVLELPGRPALSQNNACEVPRQHACDSRRDRLFHAETHPRGARPGISHLRLAASQCGRSD
jgi:hypothetical protein